MFKITIKGELSLNELNVLLKSIGNERITYEEDRTKEMNEMLKQYKDSEVDAVKEWFGANIIETNDSLHKISSNDLFSNYINWCKDHDYHFDALIKQIAFTRRLRKIHPFYKQFRTQNKVVRGFTRLNFKDTSF